MLDDLVNGLVFTIDVVQKVIGKIRIGVFVILLLWTNILCGLGFELVNFLHFILKETKLVFVSKFYYFSIRKTYSFLCFCFVCILLSICLETLDIFEGSFHNGSQNVRRDNGVRWWCWGLRCRFRSWLSGSVGLVIDDVLDPVFEWPSWSVDT